MWADWIAERRSSEKQIYDVERFEIPQLIASLPYDSWYRAEFRVENGWWRFEFEAKSRIGHFSAISMGTSPAEAFTASMKIIDEQIRGWHMARLEVGNEVPIRSATRVLIVDDDVDLALSMQTALNQLGCETEIATQYEDLHRKIVSSDADYILLDWNLNNHVTADKVVEKAIRLINAFSDLKEKFRAHRPRIVTHSVLNREQVTLPAAGFDYFDHLDHWQKPMPFPEVVKKASGLLAAN